MNERVIHRCATILDKYWREGWRCERAIRRVLRGHVRESNRSQMARFMVDVVVNDKARRRVQ